MSATGAQTVLRRVLAAAREELGMDAAWISRFEAGQQILSVVEGATEQFGIEDGFSANLASSYCTRVVAGELPTVISDAAADPRTAALAVTEMLGIGSYAGVPILLPDGDVYGMLCCVGRGKNDGIGERSIRFLQLLAEAAAAEVVENEAESARGHVRRSRVEQIIRDGALEIVGQPIVALATMGVVGVEALSRFPHGGGPDVWFSEAAAVELGTELELLAAGKALALLDRLDSGVYVGVNASPAIVADPRFADMVLGSDVPRVVVEITEHAAVTDYDALHAALTPLRRAGARLAVDDAGAGFASFRHILALRPNIIKLDVGLTSGIDEDPVRQALASALVDFAGRLSATLVAEGVETQGELDHLLTLGVDCAQGYFLARPAPLPLPDITARPVTRLLRSSMPVEPLADVAEKTAVATDFATFIRPVLEALVDITGMDAAYFSALDGDRLVRTHVHSSDRYPLAVGRSYPWNGSLCKQCVDAAILWTADVATDLRPGPEDGDIRTFLSERVTLPDGELLGTLCAIAVEPRYLSDRVVAQVKMLARLVADRATQAIEYPAPMA